MTETPSRPEIPAAEAVALYEQGEPLRVLALRYGTSKEAVRRVLLAHSVTMRKRGGNQGFHSRHPK